MDRMLRIEDPGLRMHLQSTLQAFTRDETLVDVHFVCADRRVVHAHKLTLSAVSPYMDKLLKELPEWAQGDVTIHVPGVESHYLQMLMDSLYRSETILSRQELFKVQDVQQLLGINLPAVFGQHLQRAGHWIKFSSNETMNLPDGIPPYPTNTCSPPVPELFPYSGYQTPFSEVQQPFAMEEKGGNNMMVPLEPRGMELEPCVSESALPVACDKQVAASLERPQPKPRTKFNLTQSSEPPSYKVTISEDLPKQMSEKVVKALGIPELTAVAETLRWAIEDKLKERFLIHTDHNTKDSSRDIEKETYINISEQNPSLLPENYVSTNVPNCPTVEESYGLETGKCEDFIESKKCVSLLTQSQLKDYINMKQDYGEDIKDFKLTPLQNMTEETNLLHNYYKDIKYEFENKMEDYTECLVAYEGKVGTSKNSGFMKTEEKLAVTKQMSFCLGGENSTESPEIEQRVQKCSTVSHLFPDWNIQNNTLLSGQTDKLTTNHKRTCMEFDQNDVKFHEMLKFAKVKLNRLPLLDKVVRKSPVSRNISEKQLSTDKEDDVSTDKEDDVSTKQVPLKITIQRKENNGIIVKESEVSTHGKNAPELNKAKIGSKEVDTPLLRCVLKKKRGRKEKLMPPNLNKMCMMSSELAAITGETYLTRNQAFKKVWKYAKLNATIIKHKSKYPWVVNVDEQFLKVFKKQSIPYYSIRYFIFNNNTHITEMT